MLKAATYIFLIISAYLIGTFVPYGALIFLALWTYHNHVVRTTKEARDAEILALQDRLSDLVPVDLR